MEIHHGKSFPDRIRSISYNDVVQFFDHSGVDPCCSVCGSDLTPFPSVIINGEDEDGAPVARPDAEHPAIKPLLVHQTPNNSIRYTIPVITVSCKRCGYVMHFMAERIADWKEQHGAND